MAFNETHVVAKKKSLGNEHLKAFQLVNIRGQKIRRLLESGS